MESMNMSVFSHKDFANHEQVVFCCDPNAGLKAIVAIHNTNRGPAIGPCRSCESYPRTLASEHRENHFVELDFTLCLEVRPSSVPDGAGGCSPVLPRSSLR